MNSNGNTFDYSRRQISFCHSSRDVRRYEHDGSVTVLAAKNDEDKEFNDPNDDSIWFTDPGYGALMNYEGKRHSTDNVQPFIKGVALGGSRA
jgi:gluconolactonase